MIRLVAGPVDFCNMQINWARHSWRISLNCKLKSQRIHMFAFAIERYFEPGSERAGHARNCSRERNHSFAWSYMMKCATTRYLLSAILCRTRSNWLRHAEMSIWPLFQVSNYRNSFRAPLSGDNYRVTFLRECNKTRIISLHNFAACLPASINILLATISN